MYQNVKRSLFVGAGLLLACGNDVPSSSTSAMTGTMSAGRGGVGTTSGAAALAAGSGRVSMQVAPLPMMTSASSAGAAGRVSAPTNTMAGSVAPAAAGSPAAGTGAGPTASAAAAGGGGVAANGCGAGEMCKAVELIPTPVPLKFCSMDAAAALPPSCTTPNAPCGTNGKGMCLDAAAIGFAGMMFCVYSTC